MCLGLRGCWFEFYGGDTDVQTPTASARTRRSLVVSDVNTQNMRYFFPTDLVIFFIVLPLLIGVAAAVGGRRWGWKVIALGAGFVLLPSAASIFVATSAQDGFKTAAIFAVATGAPFFLGFFSTMLIHRCCSSVPDDR